MKKRHNQPVSFNLTNKYEAGLLEFALEQDKYFSKYIKRLIEQDRTRNHTQQTQQAVSIPINKYLHEKKETLDAFL